MSDVEMTEYVTPEQIQKDLQINPAELQSAMLTQASLAVHYGVQAVRARRQYERLKAGFEILEAKLDNEHRLALKEENPRTTEAQIKAAILSDKRYMSAQARVIEAQTVWRLGEVAERGFDQRKDMLLQLARDAAKELEGQLRVVANNANRERVVELLENMKKAPVKTD